MIEKCVIDISKYQPVVDFAKVKESGVLGVIAKATQGTSGKDPKFAAHIKGAREAGLLIGAYHFATGGDATLQADFFLDVAKGVDLLDLDFEDNPRGFTEGSDNHTRWPSDWTATMLAFLRQYHGHRK